MKKIYLPPFLLLIFFALLSMSWTGPDPVRENLAFPYKLYDYYPIFVPSNNQYNKVEEVNNNYANLGRVLFYDKLFSSDGSSSCASCHKQEFSFGDNVDFSDGINDVLTNRNSSNLNDLGWQGGDGFFWDFSQKTLQDAVLQPILNPDELGLELDELIEKMKETDYYAPLFQYAFDDTEITAEKIAIALTEFINSMNTLNSKYDRVIGSSTTFTAQENLGWQLYTQNCQVCHTTPHSGTDRNRSVYNPNNIFIFNNGLDSIYNDNGWEVPNDMTTSLISTYAIFKTPTLRNLKYTAPYMHDGRFKTLEEVIDFYSSGIQNSENSLGQFYYGVELDTITGERGFLYTDVEKAAMLAFLETLNDPFLIENEKWGDPFLEEPNGSNLPPVVTYNISAGPNPVDQETTIYISNSTTVSYDLTLIDISGKIIREVKTTSGKYNLRRNNLPPGVYYLQIRKDDFKHSLKLLFL